MTAPSSRVRGLTYARDGWACVECGSVNNLQWGHRASSGHGGRGSKAPALTPADGVTQCALHNQAAEAHGQSKALSLGHKIRRNRGGMQAADIPYWDCSAQSWFLPDETGHRFGIGETEAVGLLREAGSIGMVSAPLNTPHSNTFAIELARAKEVPATAQTVPGMAHFASLEEEK